MPSSILMSMICAPFSTCCFATCNAFSKSFCKISFLNCAEPVTLVRSPTFTKLMLGEMTNGSKPESLVKAGSVGTTLACSVLTLAAMALICSGVVPQQPPTMFNRPERANSCNCSAINSGDSS